MKIDKINLKLSKSKYFLFLFIFTLGISVLLYQMYINAFQTSIIEGFGLDFSDSKMENILTAFSGLFQNKCLTGCARLDSVDKTVCNQKIDKNNGKIYECPWVCNVKKFEEDLKKNTELAQQLSGSARCTRETEKKDCGSCVPNRTFSS
jgi:hypothetical protein